MGKAVRVQWSPADEHGWDLKGPPTLIDLGASLAETGEVAAWKSDFVISYGEAGNVPLVAAYSIGPKGGFTGFRKSRCKTGT